MRLWNLITDRTAADVEELRRLLFELKIPLIPSSEQLQQLKDGLRARAIAPDKTQFTDPSGEELFLLGQNQNGSYDAADLNRVGSAGNELAALLRQLPLDMRLRAQNRGVGWGSVFDVPYTAPTGTMRTDWYTETEDTEWTLNNSPIKTFMTDYLNFIKELRDCLPANYPALPQSMEYLDYNGANAIEKVLVLLDEAIETERKRISALIDNTARGWFYSAEVFCGEV